MTEHLTDRELERLHLQGLTSQERRFAEEHLERCHECREQLASVRNWVRMADSIRMDLDAYGHEPPLHLAYEQLVGFLNGTLDPVDGELAESHLTRCPRCEKELDSLRAFQATMAAQPAREFAPARRETLADRLQGLLTLSPLGRPSVALGMAAAVVVIGLLVRGQWAGLSAQRQELAHEREALAGERASVASARTELTRHDEQLQQEQTAIADREARLRQRAAELTRQRQEVQREMARAGQTAAERTVLQRRLQELQQENRRLRQHGPGPGVAPSRGPVLALNDPSGKVLLDGNRAYQIRPLPDDVARTLRQGRLEFAAALPTPGLVPGPRGPITRGGSTRVLRPVTTIIAEDHPTFTWTANPDADGYRVSVFPKDSTTAVQSSPVIRGTEWTTPEALPRDNAYRWEVTTLQGGREIGRSPRPGERDSIFRVLSGEQRAALETQLQKAPSHLSRAVFYARTGLLDDAERELTALRQANPNAPLVQELLESIHSARAVKHPSR